VRSKIDVERLKKRIIQQTYPGLREEYNKILSSLLEDFSYVNKRESGGD